MIKIDQILSKKSFKNSVWSVLNVLITPLFVVILTPLFIAKLGPERYGFWVLITSIVASLGVLNLGASDAIVRFVSKYRASRSYDKISKIVSGALSVYLCLSILLIVASYFVFDFINIVNIVNIPETHEKEVLNALSIIGIVVSLRLLELAIVAIPKGYERFDIASRFQICSRFATLLSQLVILLLDMGLYEIFVANAVVLLCSVIIEFYLTQSLIPEIRIKFSLDLPILKEIFSYGLYSWIYSILGMAALQIDKFIVVYFLGATELAYYAIGHMVALQIHSLFSAFGSWIFPMVSNKISKGEETYGLYYNMQFTIVGLGILFILLTWFFSEPIFILWLGVEIFQSTQTYINLFMILAMLNLPTIVPYYYVNGSGHIKLNTIFKTILITVDIISMIVGYNYFGVIGLLLGRFFSPILIGSINRAFVHKIILKEENFIRGLSLTIPPIIAALVIYDGLKLMTSSVWILAISIPITFVLVYGKNINLIKKLI